MRRVHEEVRARYYGCGLVAPQAIGGAHILDLGSGSGQDAYILAQFVGEDGSVTGVDTTPEQLAVANEYLEWHREAFGYAKSNVPSWRAIWRSWPSWTCQQRITM